MFKHLLKGKSESSRLIRRYKSGSMPIVAPAGTLRLSEVAWMTLWPGVLFMFTLICLVQPYRFKDDRTWYGIIAIVDIVLMIWPTTAVLVYSLGIWKTIRNSVARSSAVIFWMYWPLCRFVACVGAIAAAWCVGN